MQPVICKLSKDLEHVELHILSDWHLGDANCDVKHVLAEIEEIEKNPNAFAIIAGDLCDTATRQSIGDVYEQLMTPTEQIFEVAAMLKPIAEKIVCAVPGNHEERAGAKGNGIDMTRLICSELGIEKVYRKDFAVLFLSFGRAEKRRTENRRVGYTVYVNHGFGGGKLPGAKANNLKRLCEICDADLYVIGHTHQPMTFKDNFLRLHPNTCGVEVVERTYINTAAALNYGGYGARKGFTPAAKSNPVAVLNGSEKRITVKI